MGSFSLMHWIVVLAIVLLIFGAGKLPRVMGDFAKGIKAFKAGMKEEDTAATTPEGQPQVTTAPPPAGTAAPRPAAEIRPSERV
jgi:sec-independent protein translocase protein TatA